MQHIPGIQSAINDLEKTGDLGVIASRWNDFRTGKIGAGDDRYTALRTAVQMLDTALVRVHARGGSNAMMEHFNALSNAGRMDAATLRSAVTELTKWVETYSKMGANRPGAVRMGGADPSKAHGEPPPAGLTPPPGNETEAQKIERLKKKYGGK
jgi:predicted RecB family endonuclease